MVTVGSKIERADEASNLIAFHHISVPDALYHMISAVECVTQK